MDWIILKVMNCHTFIGRLIEGVEEMQMQLLTVMKDGNGEEQQLLFDFSDKKVIKDLLENYQGMTFIGKNMEEETNHIEIREHFVRVRTFQKNYWIRCNVYWDDGTTEEYFDGMEETS